MNSPCNWQWAVLLLCETKLLQNHVTVTQIQGISSFSSLFVIPWILGTVTMRNEHWLSTGSYNIVDLWNELINNIFTHINLGFELLELELELSGNAKAFIDFPKQEWKACCHRGFRDAINHTNGGNDTHSWASSPRWHLWKPWRSCVKDKREQLKYTWSVTVYGGCVSGCLL